MEDADCVWHPIIIVLFTQVTRSPNLLKSVTKETYKVKLEDQTKLRRLTLPNICFYTLYKPCQTNTNLSVKHCTPNQPQF